jgi:phospholipase C
MMVISPYAKTNYVDSTLLDQSSIIHFVEDNWLHGQRIGNGSFDTITNSIANMLSIQPTTCFRYVLLNDQTGEVTGKGCAGL